MIGAESNLRTTIVGTVVGGLILAAILAFVPKALAGLILSVKFIYGLLLFEFAIPVWVVLIVLLLIPLISKTLQKIRRQSSNNETSREIPLEAPESQTPLSTLEHAIVLALVKADGKYLALHQISQLLRSSILLTESAIEGLDRRRMLIQTTHFQGYSIYRLSSYGRDYAIENGLIKS